MKALFGEALDFVFPRHCPVCGDIVVPKGEDICFECEGKLRYTEEPYCLKCGKKLEGDGQAYCAECMGNSHRFEYGRSVFMYNDDLAKSIYSFKYRKRQEYAGFYAKEMALRYKRMILELEPDAFVPIPLHKNRYRKRGYNQAELLAVELSRALREEMSVPVMRLLVRERATRPQKNLTPGERQNNLKGAFKIAGNSVKLKTVILIDDIYTTGSTMDSAAGCLYEAGVDKVYFLVLSSTSILV